MAVEQLELAPNVEGTGQCLGRPRDLNNWAKDRLLQGWTVATTYMG